MSNWTIFSNHGHVLVCLARDSEARLRDVADDVGLTERAVQKIVRDLQDNGMISVSKHGRRNRYRIDNDKPLRHDLEAHCTLGALLNLVAHQSSAEQVEVAPEAKELPVKRSVPEKQNTPNQFQPAAFEPNQSDKPADVSPVQDTQVEDEPKIAKPSKSESKKIVERQQGSLF